MPAHRPLAAALLASAKAVQATHSQLTVQFLAQECILSVIQNCDQAWLELVLHTSCSPWPVSLSRAEPSDAEECTRIAVNLVHELVPYLDGCGAHHKVPAFVRNAYLTVLEVNLPEYAKALHIAFLASYLSIGRVQTPALGDAMTQGQLMLQGMLKTAVREAIAESNIPSLVATAMGSAERSDASSPQVAGQVAAAGPRWIPEEEMAGELKAWYWGLYPGGWVWYCPTRHKTRNLDQGDGWHGLLATHYWGPFVSPPDVAPGRDAPTVS